MASNDAGPLADALDKLLQSLWVYDRETPVQTRLTVIHDVMCDDMVRAKGALFQYREKMEAIAYVEAHTHKRRRREEPVSS